MVFTLHAEEVVVVVVVVAQSDGSVVKSVVEYDELGTGNVERAQVDASSRFNVRPETARTHAV